MYAQAGLSLCWSHIQGVKCPIFSYIFLYLEDSPIYSYIWKTVLYIPIFGRQSYIFLYLEDSPIYSYIWKTVLYIPIFGRQSYIFLYLEDSPIYSYIWKTVLYIPIFQGKQEMLNSYLKQMLLISNLERCKFIILQHLLSNSHFFQVWQPCPAQPSYFSFFPGMNLGKLTYKSTAESILFVFFFLFSS